MLRAASEQQRLAVDGKGLPHLLVLRPPAFKEKGQLVLAIRGLLSPQHLLRVERYLINIQAELLQAQRPYPGVWWGRAEAGQ